MLTISGLSNARENMADAFGGDDIFSVFEDNSSSKNTKGRRKDKNNIAGPSASTDAPQTGEKRDFKPDVIDLALEESTAKKAKPDDLERYGFV